MLDPLGTACLVPGLVLVLLALQWGGSGYSWGSTRVVVSLVVGFVLLVAFGVAQWWVGHNGTVPGRILRQRSIAAGTVVSLGFGSTLTILTFYLPIWFQAIKGLSAYDAGVRLLPYFLVTVVFVIGSGFFVSKVGYYSPPLILGTALLVVGCGLLTTFRVNTSTAEYIGYEVNSSLLIILRGMDRETNTEIGSSRHRSGTHLGPSKQCRSDYPVEGRHTHRSHPNQLCAIGRRLRFRRC